MDLIHIAEASSVPKTNGKKVKIMNTFPLVRNEIIEIDQAVTISHEDNTRITPNSEAKPPRPKKRESSLKSEFKKMANKSKSKREGIRSIPKQRPMQVLRNENNNSKKSENENCSELDIDAFLLDANDYKNKDFSFEKWSEDNSISNNLQREKRKPIRVSTEKKPDLIPNKYLHPYIYKSNTGEKIKPLKSKTDTRDNTYRRNSNNQFQHNITRVSDLSECSKFISPALKNKKTVRFSGKDESISENLPSCTVSLPSVAENLLEEIKELHSHENANSWYNDLDSSLADLGLKHKQNAKSKKVKIYGNLIKCILGPRLGFGVFGDVVKAINRETGEIYAIKRLSLRK